MQGCCKATFFEIIKNNNGGDMLYVYRFINNNKEIIYIGRTQDIENRIREHFSLSGHLTQ